jgi:hypothetical protein
MDNNLDDEVKLKPTTELREIAVNFHMYRGALVAAAKKELTNRGIELSEEDLQKIEERKNQRKQQAIKSKVVDNSWDFFHMRWKQNIVDDIQAPKLFSRQVINVFSILFSVLFGGILLAINLKTINNKKAILPVIIYSLIYTGLIIFIFSFIPENNSGLTLIFNFIGAIALHNFFWGKYIGKEFQYRTKPFWIPLIIGIAITVFIIFILIIQI